MWTIYNKDIYTYMCTYKCWVLLILHSDQNARHRGHTHFFPSLAKPLLNYDAFDRQRGVSSRLICVCWWIMRKYRGMHSKEDDNWISPGRCVKRFCSPWLIDNHLCLFLTEIFTKIYWTICETPDWGIIYTTSGNSVVTASVVKFTKVYCININWPHGTGFPGERIHLWSFTELLCSGDLENPSESVI